MLVKDSKGKEVEIFVYGQHDDDIQIDEAYYTNDNSEVSDDEIEWIMDSYASDIYDEWYQNQVCAAESYYDSLMDR